MKLSLPWKKDSEEEIASIAHDGEIMMPISSFKASQAIYARREEQLQKGTPQERIAVFVPLMIVLGIQIVMTSAAKVEGAKQVLMPLMLLAMGAGLLWYFKPWLVGFLNSFSHFLISDRGVRLFSSGRIRGCPYVPVDWTTPVIPWSAITYADCGPGLGLSTITYGPEKKLNPLLCAGRGNAVRLHVNFECMPILDARKITRSKDVRQARIEIPIDGLAERDLVQIIAHVRKHLPRESIHGSADALAPAQLWQDYTTIWLQELNEGSSRVATLPPGTVLKGRDDSYEVIDRLGSGGQAVTYTAKKPDGEVVVLKEFVLPSTGGHEVVRNTMTNITKEAQLLQSLDHPHIVKCFGWFSSGRRAYLALSLINGKTLRQLVKDCGPMDEETVGNFAAQMCELLQYLHGHAPPVVHRDFTPDNLMVDAEGKLFLMDFDVARRLESQTATRTVVGKHNYMPPEQFRGQATTQSDIYAMGCTMHWLLTGEDPEPITMCRPKQINDKVSVRMDALVAKATAQDCVARFTNAADILSVLVEENQKEKTTATAAAFPESHSDR